MIDPSLLTTSAISDKDLKKIREEIDADFDKMETGEKIAINLGTNNAHYLPPPAVVFEFLGFKFSIPIIIEQLENAGVKPLDISRTSKYDLQDKGVGKRTYQKYIDWAIDAPIPNLDMIIEGKNSQLDASAKTSSNAYHWLLFLYSIKQPIQNDGDELRPEYTPLIDFIEYRCDTEIDMQQQTSNRDDYESLSRSDTHIWWPLLAKPFFAKHTVLTSDILNSIDPVIVNGSIPDDLTEAEKNALYKNLFRLKFDFILTAIAHYEIGFILASCPNAQSLQTVAPLACHAIKKYASSNENRTCFYWALQTFKGWLSKTEPNIKWKKIASYIPVNPEPNETGKGVSDEIKQKDIRVTNEASQVDRLNSWRKGKNLPSNKLLEQFTANVTESMGSQSERDSLFILFRITIGVDKLLMEVAKEWALEMGSESKVRCIWKDVLSHYYDDYYLHYLNQHIAKMEKTT